MDAGIVLITSIDAYILSQISSNRQNISFMRMVRFVRVARALRVIRTMGLFRQLRVLLNTIAMSFMSLFWSMLILFIFMLMFSLFLCQMLQSFIVDPNEEPKMREWVFRHYGTSFRALYTVFEVTFSGGWPNYARPLIEEVASTYAIFFVLYVTAVVFAMVRIISALFLKDTLQTAANDADMMVQERMKEMKAFVNKLSELFAQADESGDGNLSAEELKNIMSYPKVKVWMSVLGLDVTETATLFDMLDDGDGLISYDEFVNGIMRLKGNSRSQDTIAIMRDCERICKNCEATQRACEGVQAAVAAMTSRPPQVVVHAVPSNQHSEAPQGSNAQEGNHADEGIKLDIPRDRLQEL